MPERRISGAIGTLGPALLYATLGAVAVVAIDWASLLITLPIAGSDSLGMLAYVLSATCVHIGWLFLPMCLGLWLLERPALRALDLGPARSLAWLLAALIALAGLAVIERLLPEGQHMQFAAHIAGLRWALRGFAVLGVAALGRFVLEPLCERHAGQLSARGLHASVLVLVAAIASAAVLLAMAPVHLDRLAPPWVLLSGLGFALAARALLPPEGLPSLRPLAVAIAALFVLCVAFLGRDTHGRFLLFAHAPLSSPLARLTRDLADFDGDGAAPTLLAGTDCAPFDHARGPARRERAADGVDQDCSGGDASKHPAPERATGLVSQCDLSTPVQSVILVTVDAMRADLLDGPATPALSRFAAQVLRFERAYAPATFTFKSISSLLSMQTLSDQADAPLDAGLRALNTSFVRTLAQAGFKTGVVNYLELEPALLAGFAEQNPAITDSYATDPLHELSSAKITNTGLQFVDRHKGERFFLWLHYADAHAPYRDPKFDDPRANALAPYPRAIAYVDLHVGRLLAGLAERGLPASTAIFVSADHGEDLGEHGGHLGHGPDVYESVLRVPLLAWIPGCAPARVATPTSLLRLGPTLGAVTGVAIPGRTLLERPLPGAPAIVSEALYDEGRFPPRTFLRAVIRGQHKLVVDVRNGGRVLFDLVDDPGESYDIYRSSDAVREELEGAYQQWLDRDGER